MKQSSFQSSLPDPTMPHGRFPRRWDLCGIALLGALVLAPGPAAARQRKGAAAPAPTPGSTDVESRSNELMKKHFPLEEDIGPLPVVRVPKVEEPKPMTKAERARAARAARLVKASPQARTATPPPVAPPATTEPPPPEEKPAEKPVAAPAPKKEAPAPREGRVQASEIGTEASRQIDDLLSHALTDTVPAPAAEEDLPAPSLPPLGMAAIKETMATVQPEVKRSCRLGRLGVVQVRVVVAPSGEVARVTPEGKLAATAPASCVVDRVRRARFPRSGGGNFQYTLTVR